MAWLSGGVVECCFRQYNAASGSGSKMQPLAALLCSAFHRMLELYVASRLTQVAAKAALVRPSWAKCYLAERLLRLPRLGRSEAALYCIHLHHQAKPQAPHQSDHTDQRLHHRPAAQRLRHGQPEVLLEEPEARIVDVATGEATRTYGKYQ